MIVDSENKLMFRGSTPGSDKRDRQWDSDRKQQNVHYQQSWYFFDSKKKDYYGPFELNERGLCMSTQAISS